MTGSSTSQSTIPQSSTVAPNEEQVWRQQILEQLKPRTPAQIRAEGDIKVKIGVLWFVGVISGLLALFGGSTFLLHPDNAKDIWVIIGPIISAAVTGVVAFLTGEKAGTK